MFDRQKGGRLNVLTVTETNDIERRRGETDVLYVAFPDTTEAWELDAGQQAKHERTGEYLQVCSVKNKRPLQIFRNRPRISGQSVSNIAAQKFDEQIMVIQERNQKQSMLLWIGIICALLAVTISVIVLLKMRDNSLAAFLPLLLLSMLPASGNHDGESDELSELTDLVNKKSEKEKALLDSVIQTQTDKDNHKRAKREKQRKRLKHILETTEDLKILTEAEEGKVNCTIFVENTGTYGDRIIDRSLLPDGATERRDRGHPYYLLGLDNKGLWSIEPDDEDTQDKTPLDCYGALPWDELCELLRFSDSWGEKIKLTIFFALAFAELIILFFIATVAMGGAHA